MEGSPLSNSSKARGADDSNTVNESTASTVASSAAPSNRVPRDVRRRTQNRSMDRATDTQVQRLLASGMSMHSSQAAKALASAAKIGEVGLVRALVKARVPVDAEYHGTTALMAAASGGQMVVVQFLARHHAKVDFRGPDGATALYLACKAGHIEVVAYLLHRRASADVVTVTGKTALHVAVQGGFTDIVALLLNNWAFTQRRDGAGRRAREYARLPEIAKMLDAFDRKTALLNAAATEDLEAVKYLIARGDDLETCGPENETALLVAAGGGSSRVEIARALLDAGADRSAALKDGSSALHLAVKAAGARGGAEMTKLLLQGGVDPRSLDSRGNRAQDYADDLHVLQALERHDMRMKLLFAAEAGNLALVIHHVNHQAPIDTRGRADGATPLLAAMEKGFSDVARYLLEKGADVNAALKLGGSTSLHMAVQQGDIEMVKCLLHHGADVGLVDGNGKKPIDYALDDYTIDVLMRSMKEHQTTVDEKDSETKMPIPRLIPRDVANDDRNTDIFYSLDPSNTGDSIRKTGSRSVRLHQRPTLGETKMPTLEDAVTTDDQSASASTVTTSFRLHVTAPSYDSYPRLQVTDPMQLKKQPSDTKLASLWFIPRDAVEYDEQHVGVGSNATLHKGMWCGDNHVTEVIVKCVVGEGKNARVKFERQANVWFGLHHPNIVEMYGACGVGLPRFFVCEYVKGGNFVDHFAQDKSHLWRLFYSTALGLQYLHDQQIVHGNLKCENLLVNGNDNAKIGGFSYVRNEAALRGVAKSDPIGWQAQEGLTSDSSFGFAAADVYSFGMCIIEAFSGEPPYGDPEDQEVAEVFVEGNQPPRPDGMQDDEWELVKQLCSRDVHDRIRFIDAIESLRYFSDRERVANGENLQSLRCGHCATVLPPGAAFCRICGHAGKIASEQLNAVTSQSEEKMGFINLGLTAEENVSTLVRRTARQQLHARIPRSNTSATVRLELVVSELIRKLERRCTHQFVLFRGVINHLKMLLLLGRISTGSPHGQVRVEIAVIELLASLSSTRYQCFDEYLTDIQTEHRRSEAPSCLMTLINDWILDAPNRAKFAFSIHKMIDCLALSNAVRDGIMKRVRPYSWENDRREQAKFFCSQLPSTVHSNSLNNTERGRLSQGVQYWMKRMSALSVEEVRLLQKVASLLGNQNSLQYRATDLSGESDSYDSDLWIPRGEVRLANSDKSSDTMLSRQLGEWCSTPVLIWNTPSGQQPAASRWYGLRHPHVVNLLGCCKNKEDLLFICANHDDISLIDYLSRDQNKHCVWQRLHEATLGLQYLHDSGITHNDIRCSNVLVGKDGIARIGGLWWNIHRGSKQEQDSSNNAPSNPLATFLSSDIYSFGVAIAEAITGDTSWQTTPQPGVIDEQMPCRPETGFRDDQWEMVQKMCCKDTALRSTINDVVQKIAKFADEEFREIKLQDGHSGLTSGLTLLRTVPAGEELSRAIRRDWTQSPSSVKGLNYSNQQLEDSAVHTVSASRGGGGDYRGKSDETTFQPIWYIPEYESWTAEFEPCGETPFTSSFLGTWSDSVVVIERLNPMIHARKYLAETADVWYKLKHPNVLHLFGACHDVPTPFFVREYAPLGTLKMYLQDNQQELWRRIYNVACALRYLHTRGIVHNDMKCENVLVTKDGQAKLSGFHLSHSENAKSELRSQASTQAEVRWTAPEVLSGVEASFASDVYSLGMLIIEAATSQLPWGECHSDIKVRQLVAVKHMIPAKPDAISNTAWGLVKRMCCFNPTERLEMSEVARQLKVFAAVERHVPQQHEAFTQVGDRVLVLELVLRQYFVIHDKPHIVGNYYPSRPHDEVEFYDADSDDALPQRVEVIAEFAAQDVFGGNLEVQLQSMRKKAGGECTFGGSESNEGAGRQQCRPDWYIDASEIEIQECIARGGFGSVRFGTWLGAPVAVKSLLRDDIKALRRECKLWYPLNFPYIVNLFGANDGDKPFFVCDLADSSRGHLGEAIKSSRTSKLHVWKLLYQTASALQYLHSCDTIHADLKGDNVLIKEDGSSQLTDFGLSFNKLLTRSQEIPQTAAVRWKAPECARGERPTRESDIYSLGMCIIEALSGRLPWEGVMDSLVDVRIRNNELPQKASCMNETEWVLVQLMCCSDPRQRLELDVVVDVLRVLAFDKLSCIENRLFTAQLMDWKTVASFKIVHQSELASWEQPSDGHLGWQRRSQTPEESAYDRTGSDALLIAAQCNDLETMRALLPHHENVEVRSKRNNFTPLCWAAHAGYLEMVQYLIVKGAAIDATTPSGFSPLLLAASGGHADVVQHLLMKGADPEICTARNGFTALLQAASKGYAGVVQHLVKKRVNLEVRSADGATALHLAASMGHAAVVQLLLAGGADYNAVIQRDGSTALHLAAFMNQLSVVWLLVRCGADPQIKDSKGLSAVDQAHSEQVRRALLATKEERDSDLTREWWDQFRLRHAGGPDVAIE